MESTGTWILSILFFFALSALLSATEAALTSLSVLKTKNLRESLGKRGKILDFWIENPQVVLASVLIGNAASLVCASILLHGFLEAEGFAGSDFLSPFLTTSFYLVFCQLLPRALVRDNASGLALPLLFVFRPFYLLLRPLAALYSRAQAGMSVSLAQQESRSSPQITEEELEFLINVGEEEGIIADEKHEMLSGIFELGDTVAREIMVHRVDVKALATNMTLLDALELSRRTGLSRFPVYKGNLDKIVAVLHAKDLMALIVRHPQDVKEPLDKLLVQVSRAPLFVPESKPVDQLFQEMRRQRQHLAVVLDEYGSLSGLVTMEDILEEIVGEVRDEFDDEEDAIRKTEDEREFIVECKVHIDDFCSYFDIDTEKFTQKDASGNAYDTLGGLILHHFGQIPKTGDSLTLEGHRLDVLEVSRRRVRKVKVRVLQEVSSQAQEESPQETKKAPEDSTQTLTSH
jgi:putative hemolysin